MKMTTLLLTPLMLIFTLQADTISKGSTFHQYSKPGASIDMEYTSDKVDVNETSDINITLTTPLTQGEVSVTLTLDEGLNTIKRIDKNLTYLIQPQTQNFLINFQVQSDKADLYYIRLLTKVTNDFGTKLRSFAIPVYIGQKQTLLNKRISPSMKALNLGENISVSKAIETIKTLKEE